MRKYLKKVNIVGSTMCYQEEGQCRRCLDWLVKNCDKVIVLLDNYNKKTEDIVLQYKERYKENFIIIYSTEPFIEQKNLIHGQIKKRFKIRQQYIREQVIKGFKELNKTFTIDLIVWLDSDELPINQFGEILEEFWNREESYLMCGFVEPYNNFKQIISQGMAPHARVFKYKSEMSAFPYSTRTRYQPYINEKAWKVRHCILHLNHFTKKYRERREFFDNRKFSDEQRDLWILPKDIRKMTHEEIADYQPGDHRRPSKYKSSLLTY